MYYLVFLYISCYIAEIWITFLTVYSVLYCILYAVHSVPCVIPYICTIDWVNLYKKFESEKYTVCGKLILPKKWKGIFFLAQLACEFAWICEYLQASCIQHF